jgi:two-component system cell cycle sensor histidine kinase/response regulator CckA
MQDDLSKTWRARETARVELARLRISDDASVEPAVIRALGISARAIKVERVGVWFFDAARDHLASVLMLDHGEVINIPYSLRVLDIGRYEDALSDRRVLAAGDVRAHPLTLDLVESYFEPLGICAALDAPIYRNGQVVGVVCHEHRGKTRTWSETDAAFAVSMAEVVASLYASADLAAAEASLRERDAALHALERERALETVARGVAHDVNNMLSVISIAVSVLRRDPSVARIPWAAERIEAAAALCAQLLLYGGEIADASGRSEIDVELERIAPGLRSLAGEDRNLEVVFGASGKVVPLDPIELERIASNLIANARDATTENGRIVIATSHDRAAREVVLSVTDDGRGLDPALASRVFEPYFSTKGDRGRGLGLATVHGLVRAVLGSVAVESVPGEGAVFTVRLPTL